MIKEITFNGLNLEVEINDNFDPGDELTAPCRECEIKIYRNGKRVKWLNKHVSKILELLATVFY